MGGRLKWISSSCVERSELCVFNRTQNSGRDREFPFAHGMFPNESTEVEGWVCVDVKYHRERRDVFFVVCVSVIPPVGALYVCVCVCVCG